MKVNFLRNLTQSFYHIILNQFFGLVLFFILSSWFSKTVFGELNWALAILLVAFNLLSLGMDWMMVRKVATGENAASCLRSYLFHVLISGLAFYLLLLVIYFFIPGSTKFNLLLLLALGKLMIHVTQPFKQLAAGLEKFSYLKWMSVISNAVKASALLVMIAYGNVTITKVVIVFILSDVAEMVVTLILGRKLVPANWMIGFSFQNYKNLLLESLPQAGVTVFTFALARFDWILIGILLPAAKLGEYSFAYKVFELSTLPLLIIAPLLLPLLVRMFQNKISYEQKDLVFLLRVQLVIASVVIILLNLCWNPFIDYVTNGKYGAVNTGVIMLLSLSMPFLYLNNFLWTINFAKGKTASILKVFIISFLVNVIANIILVPIYGNEGAASAYFMAMIVQTLLYLRFTELITFETVWKPFLFCLPLSLVCIFSAKFLFTETWIILAVALVLHLLALLITDQIRLHDWQRLKKIMSW